jgi:hypothetical protein
MAVKSDFANLPPEEKRRLFYERLESGYYNRKPQPLPIPVAVVPVSEKIAEAVKANPQSVRVSARGTDDIAIVEGPRRDSMNVRVMIEYVREVDADGRPVWSSVVSDYDPLSRL